MVRGISVRTVVRWTAPRSIRSRHKRLFATGKTEASDDPTYSDRPARRRVISSVVSKLAIAVTHRYVSCVIPEMFLKYLCSARTGSPRSRAVAAITASPFAILGPSPSFAAAIRWPSSRPARREIRGVMPAMGYESSTVSTVRFSVFRGGGPGLKERGLPTPSRKDDASRPGRKPTRWETTVNFHPPVLPDSAVRAHVSRSTGRSSPAPNGGCVDPEGRPVGGANKTPRRANRGRKPHQSPTLNERTRQGERSRVGSVTRGCSSSPPSSPSRFSSGIALVSSARSRCSC